MAEEQKQYIYIPMVPFYYAADYFPPFNRIPLYLVCPTCRDATSGGYRVTTSSGCNEMASDGIKDKK